MRYYYNRKARAEESCDLSIYRLRKQGMLSGNAYMPITWVMSNTGKETSISLTIDITTDNPYARFQYRITDQNANKTDYDYQVSLVTTPCNFGGVRYWFECPFCRGRVGVLYLAPGDNHFRCRHCNDLSYHSRNRCVMGAFGHTSRQIDELRSQIKRWTWRGRPTRKVRKLRMLEQKASIYSRIAMSRIDKLRARVERC